VVLKHQWCVDNSVAAVCSGTEHTKIYMITVRPSELIDDLTLAVLECQINAIIDNVCFNSALL